MNYSSRAIALTYKKYSETSIISKIFTEEKGVQSFIIKGVRTTKSTKKLGLFQALTLLNIQATHQEKKTLQYLKDLAVASMKTTHSLNITKSFIYLFVAEVLSKILQDNKTDNALFTFIWTLRVELEKVDEIDKNFPLIFLLKLTVFLGFSPSIQHINNPIFNLETADFILPPPGGLCINAENSHYLKALLLDTKINIPYQNRNQLLYHLINYYKLQHHELKNMTSHLVIESLRT